ncbi:MAG: hypothetical protein GKR89_16185 [Candidatus Latescibacteria bacterium]|nr:hypothetical protein [Candidatus Latescibacterota bacterium]
MDRPITEIAQVTAQWLGRRLQANGHVADPGAVSGVEIQASSQNSPTVLVAQLKVAYAEGVTGLPAQLFFKSSDADNCAHREIGFHRDILAHMETSPTVRCFDGLWDAAAERGHMLFADVSQTHYQTRDGVHLSLQAEAERIVDALAPFHAFWWDHPLLGEEVGSLPQGDYILWGQGPEGYAKGLGRFADKMGDRLSGEQRTLCERILAAYPCNDLRGNLRLQRGNGLTLVHGDAHYENIMLPRNPAVDSVHMIDWAFWELRLGTDDIAHVGLYGFCEPETGLVRDLVRRYYEGLLRHGVEDYSWGDCWHDYRLSTIRHLFIPINSALYGGGLDYCWRNFERSLRSFKDLDCTELLS